MNDSALIEELLAQTSAASTQSVADAAIERFLKLLECGELRCVTRDGAAWRVEMRVKQLILNVFRWGKLEARSDAAFQFCDKHNLWPELTELVERKIRVVPGGSTVRRGAYLANGVTVMPPAYINIGAFVDEGTMIDSHATVGSCAQVGKRCHISAAAQLGGVLEPVGQLPVIIEDDAFVGGNVGIYEGTRVSSGAVIGSGVILTRATPVYDLINESVIRPVDGVLVIPPRAVVVCGARAVKTPFGKDNGLSLYAPMIVKYRDEKTDASTTLESALRALT